MILSIRVRAVPRGGVEEGEVGGPRFLPFLVRARRVRWVFQLCLIVVVFWRPLSPSYLVDRGCGLGVRQVRHSLCLRQQRHSLFRRPTERWAEFHCSSAWFRMRQVRHWGCLERQ